MAIEQKLFGVANGETVYEYAVSRGNLTVKILNCGGIVRCFNVQTAKGDVDVVLGYDTVSEYESNNNYFGGIIGRVANRISGGSLRLTVKNTAFIKIKVKIAYTAGRTALTARCGRRKS